MGFPQLANIDKRIFDTISSRTGNNVGMSQKQPWVKVTSTLHNYLSLESIRGNETFAQRYGDTNKSGRVGIDRNPCFKLSNFTTKKSSKHIAKICL